ncbi:MAG: DUF309 domain-containing protein [Chloroflexi bacterium]|jgi:hypothetical protein|nr:DUF309 domain-containing protein [Chloroflexota bacterium]
MPPDNRVDPSTTLPPHAGRPRCDLPLHPRAREGLRYFNAGLYFEAHEELEAAWREETEAIRDLYRGILQVGVAYYHIQRANYNGARKLLLRCRPWLAPYPDWCRGIHVEKLRQDYQIVERKLIQLGPEQVAQIPKTLLKPIEWEERG